MMLGTTNIKLKKKIELYTPPNRNKRRKNPYFAMRSVTKLKLKKKQHIWTNLQEKATFMTSGRIVTFIVQFSHTFQQDRLSLSLGCHVDVYCVVPTLSKTSLMVHDTSARITTEVNNNNLFSTWILVFWNVTPCFWMSVPDFSTKTAWLLKIKALPSFHIVETARPPTQRHIPTPLNHHLHRCTEPRISRGFNL